MKHLTLILLAGCIILPCAARGKTVDTLLYTTPLTATGYSHTSVYRIGSNIPKWEIKTEENTTKTGTSLPGLIGIGMTAHGYDIVFSKYPFKLFTTATTLSYRHETTKQTMTREEGLADSILQMLASNSIVLPTAVLQSSTLDHIRYQYEVRLNTIQLFDAQQNLPFAVNPYIGAGLFVDAGFGELKQHSIDSTTQMSSSLDTIFKKFDSTYTRVNVDVGLAIPIGVEIFPFSKSSITALNYFGISFTYTLFTRYRMYSYPDRTVNPYKDIYDTYNNSSNNNNSGDSSGSSSSDNNSVKIGWFGFKNIKADNEFRIAVHYSF